MAFFDSPEGLFFVAGDVITEAPLSYLTRARDPHDTEGMIEVTHRSLEAMAVEVGSTALASPDTDN